MTNDFSVEQKRPSAAPYGIVGLAAGAGLGTQLPKWTGKPKTVDQLIEDMNNKDEFTKNTAEGAEHATEWKDLHAQAEKVKAAEKAAEEASKPALPTTSVEARELADAKEKLQKEIDRLQSIENSKAGVTSVSGEFNPNKLPTFDKLHNADLPGTYAEDFSEGLLKKHKQGDKIATADMQVYYDKLKQNVIDKYNDMTAKIDSATFDADTGRGARKKQNDIITAIKNEVNKITVTGDDKVYQYFHGDFYDAAGNLNPSAARQTAQDIVNRNKTTLYSLPKEDLLSIGELFDKVPKYDSLTEAVLPVQVIDETTGRPVTKRVKYNKQQYGELLAQRKKELAEKEKSMVDEIVTLLEDAYTKKQNVANFDTVFEQGIRLSDADATGLYNKSTGKLDLKTIINKGVDEKAFDADIEKLKKIISTETAGESANETILSEYVTKPTTGFGTANAETALERANARKEILTQYLNGKKETEQLFNDSLRATELVRQYDPMIEKAISNETEYAKALESFKKAFPTLGDEVATVSSSARTITESDVAESFRNAVKDKQKIYDDAVAKNGGKIDEAAKKAADELLNTEKEKLTKMGEELSGKIGKVPGMKKGWGVALGAIALGVVGLGIGKAVNKNKNA